MSDFDTMQLGREAAGLLRNPVFQAALARAEQQILTEWAETHPSATGRREELHAELRGLRRFHARVRAMELDGRQVDDKRRMRA